MQLFDDMKREDTKIDMTPMIDIVFLLIIFFMVVTEMVHRDYESLTLPKATQAIEDIKAPENRQVINITYVPPTGGMTRVLSSIIIQSIKYDDQAKLISYLQGKAAQAGKDPSDPSGIASKLAVKIRADGRCEYQKVQRAMVACMKAGIRKVSFGAAPTPK